jgi:hypothetical protein
MPWIAKIDMGLWHVVDQEHPRSRPVQVTDKLDPAAGLRLILIGLVPAATPVRHTHIFQRYDDCAVPWHRELAARGLDLRPAPGARAGAVLR